ncbi:MAG: hypothetical protein AMXMBFR31_28390 [Candidatus Desulfobacillus denitrificans]
MILEILTIPCPHCLAEIEAALLAVPPEALAEMRSVFCPQRHVALTVAVRRGRLATWHLWPCDSAEELHAQLAGIEAAMTLAAAGEAARAPKH